MIADTESQRICVKINNGELGTAGDFISNGIGFLLKDQIFQGNGYFLPNTTLSGGTPIRGIDAPKEADKQIAITNLRRFISTWYYLEREGLVRSIPFNRHQNLLCLAWAATDRPGPSRGAEELYNEAVGFLDKRIVPLSGLADFVARNSRQKIWLTVEEDRERKVLAAAHRGNWIAFIVGIFAIGASIVFPLVLPLFEGKHQ